MQIAGQIWGSRFFDLHISYSPNPKVTRQKKKERKFRVFERKKIFASKYIWSKDDLFSSAVKIIEIEDNTWKGIGRISALCCINMCDTYPGGGLSVCCSVYGTQSPGKTSLSLSLSPSLRARFIKYST